MHTKNLVVMFVDMEGFTCLTSTYSRKQISFLLDTLNKTIKPKVKEFRGEIIKALGDGYIIVFDSPTNAVLCGMKIQEAVSTHNAVSPSDEFFELRIAINSGEVTLKNGDVFGEPVNLASRIEKTAEPGEIYLSQTVYLAMNQNEVPVKKVGRGKLRGIPGNVQIYKVSKEQSEIVKHKILRGREVLANYFLPKDKLSPLAKTKKKGLLPKRQLGYFLLVLAAFAGVGLLASAKEVKEEQVEPKLLISDPATAEKQKEKVQAASEVSSPTPAPTSTPTPQSEKGRGRGHQK